MTGIEDLRDYFGSLDHKLIIAADGETRTDRRKGRRTVRQRPAGGVAVAFDTVAQAAVATYIGRAKTPEDRQTADENDKVCIRDCYGEYTLKRVFLTPEEEQDYYAGYANQTLWPLCHISFQRPEFNEAWFDGYRRVNEKFAASIQEEMADKSFVWINDYQLALVPSFLERSPDTVVGVFWHIPWPTWEVFRILPQRRQILDSLLNCDFIAFHRRYQARNFLTAVDRELGGKIDYETNTISFDGRTLRVAALPMGIDVDILRTQLQRTDEVPDPLGEASGEDIENDSAALAELRQKYRILLGVDRLDYTKGIKERLMGIDNFLEANPAYRGKVAYVGVMSPTRDAVPAYQQLRNEVESLALEINDKYRTAQWHPLHMLYEGLDRDAVVELYRDAAVCLVTPLDDGMNLVSKEFVVAASTSDEPGMLVLSQFAGSATDLSASVIVNPYDSEGVGNAIKAALEMDVEERKRRVEHMVSLLEETNVYDWAISFVREATNAARDQQHESVEVY